MMKLTQNNLLNLWPGLLKHDYHIKRKFKKIIAQESHKLNVNGWNWKKNIKKIYCKTRLNQGPVCLLESSFLLESEFQENKLFFDVQ